MSDEKRRKVECLKCGTFHEPEELWWGAGIDEEENCIIGDWEVVCRDCFYELETKYKEVKECR